MYHMLNVQSTMLHTSSFKHLIPSPFPNSTISDNDKDSYTTMSTTAVIASTILILATLMSSIESHGYVLIPQTQFKGLPGNEAWIVQIDPLWKSSDWNGNTEQSVKAYQSLKAANNFKDLKTLMETHALGPECGFSDPKGKPQPIPKDGKATLSRAIVHRGPCEMWLDNKKVLYEDDCYAKYGNEDAKIKSVLPVDYSSCANGGCKEMRFYWLAFQGIKGITFWQSYKNCIPLQGSGGGVTEGFGDAEQSSDNNPEQITPENKPETTPDDKAEKNQDDKAEKNQDDKAEKNQDDKAEKNQDDKAEKNQDEKAEKNSDDKAEKNSDDKAEKNSDDKAEKNPADKPETTPEHKQEKTPEVTPAPSSKCRGRKLRN
ncbi:uncharacterized protein PHALS_03179 [Plasmopara halstedii]|uniref:RxLR-like protein n=1 Tax=Plasmopara halstedii TaxID=4781 RepID=A0A0P1A3Z3_PLAHL|nr:uncharacterized protein PHALS_03179 [Plasmopara halstedii]CEG35209.1 hypothetical protein PHALS_03179 [Plasmopara halstedii]|eukprot:XP_024571578.1 hypothetical protein PHALS_03179 [Plasmopara halstedii]